MTMSPRWQDLPEIPPLIHQALLNPLLPEEELLDLCDASRQLGFGGVCVGLNHLKTVRSRLGGRGSVTLIATIAFPFGDLPAELKLAQAEWAAAHGAEALAELRRLCVAAYCSAGSSCDPAQLTGRSLGSSQVL